MDEDNLEGHEAMFHVKTAYLITHLLALALKHFLANITLNRFSVIHFQA